MTDATNRPTKTQERLTLWVARNKGILSLIAGQCGVTHGYVSHVLHGRRMVNSDKSRCVAARLKEAGAPGFPKA